MDTTRDSAAAAGSTGASDEQVLASFGYKQELRRSLKFFSLFAISFSFISVTAGIFLNFGFGLAHMGPASIWLFLVVGAGQVLVALVLAELGTRIPLAGYSYQWGTRLMNSTYGWFIGWTSLAWMTTGSAGISSMAAAPILASLFGWDASNTTILLVIALVMTAIVTVVNVISVVVAARINNIAVFTEVIGTAFIGLLLLVLWIAHTKPGGSIGILANTGGLSGGALLLAIPYAALMGAYTLAGMEVAADLSEEAIRARVTVPRAIISSVVIATIVGMIALIGFTVAIPNVTAITASATPIPDILTYWLGSNLTKVFLVFVVFSIFALTVVISAAQARLLYAMGRDNMLPFSGTLRRVNPGTKTPVIGLLVGMALTMLLILYGYLQSSGFVVLVSASATLPFLVYLMALIAYARRRPELAAMPDAFSLGSAAGPVLVGAIVWIVAILLALIVPTGFWPGDIVIVGAEVLALAWYVFGLRPRYQRGEAGPAVNAGVSPRV
jgi:amino acid transporter